MGGGQPALSMKWWLAMGSLVFLPVVNFRRLLKVPAKQEATSSVKVSGGRVGSDGFSRAKCEAGEGGGGHCGEGACGPQLHV